jgi:AcrR family transcriptional regulator
VLAALRRRDILDRAAQLMEQKGYGGNSAQNIADALEFSKANFFYHVKSKEDLLYHIFIDALHFSIRHLEAILARKGPASEKLRTLVDFYVRLMTDHAAVMQVWFKEKGHLTHEHEADVTALENRIGTLLEGFFADAMRRGEFRRVHPRLPGMSIVGMCFSFTRWPDIHSQLSLQELTNQMQKLVTAALVRKG